MSGASDIAGAASKSGRRPVPGNDPQLSRAFREYPRRCKHRNETSPAVRRRTRLLRGAAQFHINT